MARKKKLSKLNVFLGVLIIIALIAISIGMYTLINNPEFATSLFNKENENLAQNENKVIEEIPEDTIINIVGIGDTLCHSQNYKDAYNQETGTYDFSPMFKNITKYFDNATVAVGNLETTLAGKDRGYSGYPTFNSPDELALDLKELGIDILTTANNHCIDKGYSTDELLRFLKNSGCPDVSIQTIKANIEDCFMQLVNNPEKAETTIN